MATELINRAGSIGGKITQYDVSVIPNDFNIVTINNLIESGAIEMPSFQRNYIWDNKRASKFIESLILGLPIPQVFLYQKERNKFLVIDGQQRLLTIYYFIKQRFPLSNKRAELRHIFDENGHIPNSILSDDSFFQDFKLKFGKLETGENHMLEGQKYNTLGTYKSNFEFMTMRCMAVRQNEPKDDDGAIFEIFNRLNTGGVNLTSQEIRACLYYSKFYKMLYRLNQNDMWRALWGKSEDGKSKDIEVILRSFAMLLNGDSYAGSMNLFINRFAKQAMAFEDDKIQFLYDTFISYVSACRNIPRTVFITQTGSFNSTLFETLFVAMCDKNYSDGVITEYQIDNSRIDSLKADSAFIDAITHSTSHTSSVRTRIAKAREYLL